MLNKQKKVFIYIFLGLTVLLVVLPFVVAGNELLTKIVERNVLYVWIQDNVVPVEAKMIGALLIPFGYKYRNEFRFSKLL